MMCVNDNKLMQSSFFLPHILDGPYIPGLSASSSIQIEGALLKHIYRDVLVLRSNTFQVRYIFTSRQ